MITYSRFQSLFVYKNNLIKFPFKVEIGVESIYKNRTNRLPFFDRFDPRENISIVIRVKKKKKKENDLIGMINIDLLISIHSRFIIHYSNQRCIENVYAERRNRFKI